MNPLSLDLILILLFLTQHLTSATPLLRRPIPHCNAPSPPSSSSPSPHHVPAVFSECMRLIKLIPTIAPSDPTLPIKWAADPAYHPDFALPARWKASSADSDILFALEPGSRNKCVVEINLKEGEKGSDRSNLEDLTEAAKAVAVECVIRPPHLGGWVQVGW
ncbi:MAG: hypothetical protein Q9208_006465 [Pyrenodesmia sp. 3 TL-2023]